MQVAQHLRPGLRLVKKPIGSGGFGSVFEIEHAPDLLFKVDRDLLLPKPKKSKETLRRESRYLDHLIALGTDALLARTSWPMERRRAIHDGKTLEGIVLRHVASRAPPNSVLGKTAPALLEFYNPGARKQKFPDATWRDSFIVARDIARAVAIVHHAGFVHGDINHRNVLIDAHLRPTLIDMDSVFDPRHPLAPCRIVGGEDYRAPEIQAGAGQKPTEDHDRFALATLLFKVLMQGHSPFASRQAADEPDIALADMVRFGNFTPTRRRRDDVPYDPPPTMPPLHCLPDGLPDLFERAFDPGLCQSRPSALEWARTLDAAARKLVVCSVNPAHYMAAGSACVWCAFEKRKVSYYPSRPKPARPAPTPRRTPSSRHPGATRPMPTSLQRRATAKHSPGRVPSLATLFDEWVNAALGRMGHAPWPSSAIRFVAALLGFIVLLSLSMCALDPPQLSDSHDAEVSDTQT